MLKYLRIKNKTLIFTSDLKTNKMTNEVTISAGEILTKNLLNKVNKAAYQFGGFKTKGGIVRKSFDNMNAKTTIVIEQKYINSDTTKFIETFEKTMNASYYKIELG